MGAPRRPFALCAALTVATIASAHGADKKPNVWSAPLA